MIGIAAYDSDEEAPPPAAPAGGGGAAASDSGSAGAAATGAGQTTPEAPAPGPPAAGDGAAGAAASAPQSGKKPQGGLDKRVPAIKLRELRKQIGKAKSATATVQLLRNSFDSMWDTRWGSEALYQIAMRSTARTRKEWASDKSIIKLADRLKSGVAASMSSPARREEDVYVLLTSLEGLRRMTFQDPQAQKEALERANTWIVADGWDHPVKSLARLCWLGAPLKLKGGKQPDGGDGGDGGSDCSGLLPNEIRARAPELDGPDLALLIAAMQHPAARDVVLLQKVVSRMKAEGMHAGVSATDLVEMAEGLRVLGVEDEGALRPLGQETLRRRGELTPDESHRAHTVYQALKLPLPQVWAQPGATKKRGGAQITTTQAFAPQEGHEKKRRGNHDIERTSPPRVVRDYKMMSY